MQKKSDTGNNRGKNKNLKIILKTHLKHHGTVRNQGTTENGNIEHCACGLESTDVKVQNIQNGK